MLPDSKISHDINMEPLVSIVVITYNSSKYVLETLDSIKAQTYKNIELIVSDDCSTDETIDLCTKWINENKNHFASTQLLQVSSNKGIAPNINRGYRAARGEWIKGIAGDDLLMPDCIMLNIKFVNLNNTQAVFSGRHNFSGKCDMSNVEKKNNGKLPIYMNPEITLAETISIGVKR